MDFTKFAVALLLALPFALGASATKTAYDCPEAPAASAFPNPPDVTNPYFPLDPGTVYVYAGSEGDVVLDNVVTVTHDTKTVLGVKNVVVLDEVYEDGDLVERTFDYYAEADDGDVWYFGEDSFEYQDGVLVGTAGTWLAGVDGARAGRIMLADPQVGDAYCQEDAPGVAADRAKVLSVTDSECVPYGCANGNVLETFDDTPFDRKAVEEKTYFFGVGMAAEEGLHGSKEQLSLESFG